MVDKFRYFFEHERAFVGIALSAHFISILFLILYLGPVETGDTSTYINLARTIHAEGRLGTWCGDYFNYEAVRMPGYPLFLAFCFAVFGESLLAVIVVQSLLFLASTVLMWQACRQIFGPRVGQIFLLISMTYPFIAYSSVQILTESVSVFLVSLGLFLISRDTARNFFIGGAAISLSAYLRPNLVLLPVAIAILYLLFGQRQRLLKPLMLVFSAAVVMAPWVARNYVVFGIISPLPVVSSTGVQLFYASWQSRLSAESLVVFGTTGEFTDEAKNAGLQQQIAELQTSVANRLGTGEIINALGVLGDCDTVEKKALMDNELRAVAVDNIARFPVEYILDSLKKIFRMWFTSYALHTLPSPVRILFLLQGIVLTALGYLGILIAVRKRKENVKALILAATVLYFPLTLVAFHTEARYTIPGRFALLVLAAYAITFLLGKLKTFHKPLA